MLTVIGEVSGSLSVSRLDTSGVSFLEQAKLFAADTYQIAFSEEYVNGVLFTPYMLNIAKANAFESANGILTVETVHPVNGYLQCEVKIPTFIRVATFTQYMTVDTEPLVLAVSFRRADLVSSKQVISRM